MYIPALAYFIIPHGNSTIHFDLVFWGHNCLKMMRVSSELFYKTGYLQINLQKSLFTLSYMISQPCRGHAFSDISPKAESFLQAKERICWNLVSAYTLNRW